MCIPHLGMLSRSSLTNSPSRLASRLHVTRASHVHGSDSSSSSSSSLSNHFWRTARMKSSWSWCFLHSFLTVGLSASSLYAKSSHCVGSCEVIQCMILRLPLEPSLFFILMSSFIVGLEPDVVITMYVRIKIRSLAMMHWYKYAVKFNALIQNKFFLLLRVFPKTRVIGVCYIK